MNAPNWGLSRITNLDSARAEMHRLGRILTHLYSLQHSCPSPLLDALVIVAEAQYCHNCDLVELGLEKGHL